jgi:hypothetical protein
MNHKDAIHILTEHNKWRRGQAPYDGLCPEYNFKPREIGEAIDYAIAGLEAQK